MPQPRCLMAVRPVVTFPPMTLRAVATVFLLALAGCGGDAGGSVDDNFSIEPQQVIQSDSGTLRIEIRSAPHPAVRGVNRFRLDITGAAGAPAEGLQIAVQPWMAAHGHGTSVVPLVKPLGAGSYEVDQVYLYMAGAWQLRLTFSAPESDSAAPTLDVP